MTGANINDLMNWCGFLLTIIICGIFLLILLNLDD